MYFKGKKTGRVAAIIKATVDSGCTTTLMIPETEIFMTNTCESSITVGGFEGNKRVKGSKRGDMCMRFVLQDGLIADQTYSHTVNTVRGLNKNLFSVSTMIHKEKYSFYISGITGSESCGKKVCTAG